MLGKKADMLRDAAWLFEPARHAMCEATRFGDRGDRIGPLSRVWSAAVSTSAGCTSPRRGCNTACDAGALAGRKAMGGGTWSQSNGMPNTVATQFFDANFAPTSYGTRNLTKAFAESAGKVTGTASVELQMTLVKVVTKDWAYATLNVTCDAEMRPPNTDIMFVLDNTGSMDQKAVSTDTDTKMESLKTAVRSLLRDRRAPQHRCQLHHRQPGHQRHRQPGPDSLRLHALFHQRECREAAADRLFRRLAGRTSHAKRSRTTSRPTPIPTRWHAHDERDLQLDQLRQLVDKQFTKPGTSGTNCSNNVPADTAPSDHRRRRRKLMVRLPARPVACRPSPGRPTRPSRSSTTSTTAMSVAAAPAAMTGGRSPAR